MNIDIKNLTPEQRAVALQRLTALWAFTESGLGGVLHAFKMPFTGLTVGGIAIIIIALIAEISDRNYKQILKSVIIVLLVKAMVSPHTPFPAYIAVSFQGLFGFLIFSIFRVSLFSILIFSIVAMLESAIQKLLILTLFFGESFWTAINQLADFIANQFGTSNFNGSLGLISVYLGIYILGGLFIAYLAYKTIRGKYLSSKRFSTVFNEAIHQTLDEPIPLKKKKFLSKIWFFVLILLIISAILFVFANDPSSGWQSVLKTVSWTLSVILIWYLVIGPLFTKFIKTIIHKKESPYSDEIFRTLSFLPALKQLSKNAWIHSKQFNKKDKLYFFFYVFIRWSLTYTEQTENNT